VDVGGSVVVVVVVVVEGIQEDVAGGGSRTSHGKIPERADSRWWGAPVGWWARRWSSWGTERLRQPKKPRSNRPVAAAVATRENTPVRRPTYDAVVTRRAE